MTDELPLPQLYGLREIAAYLGIAYPSVRQLRARNGLPEPDVVVSGTPLWRASTIRTWAVETGRKTA